MLLSSLRTPDFHDFNVKFSPFLPYRIACSSSKNFGIHGAGSLFVFDDVLSNSENDVPVFKGEWSDGLFDVAWSETCENTVVTASGDGSIQIWNLQTAQFPTTVLTGHSKEVSTLDWSQSRVNNLLISGSWDGTVKTWDCDVGTSVCTFSGHNNKIYCVTWSPLIPHCFASASGDGSVLVWANGNGAQPVLKIPTQSDEILSCAWNYYDKDILVSAGVDSLIKGWDLRQATMPVFQLAGHSYAIKNIKFSPHMKSILASVSYDYTTRIWDFNYGKELQCFKNHSEFASGLDFNSHVTGLMADCGWDQKIQLFSWPCLTVIK